MRNDYIKLPDGYRESIRNGMAAARGFLGGISRGTGTREEQLERLRREIREADAVVIGAGAGLSTAAGFVYGGERFEKYFPDFKEKFGITDMYSGGFYPFPEEEIRWAWWARNIYFNRFVDESEPVYHGLRELVEGKDYFVITTNVDHQFQRAGFDKKRLFYTQGDYGLFQCPDGSVDKTWDNEEWVMKAMEAQGFVKDGDGIFDLPADGRISMRIPTELIPYFFLDFRHVHWSVFAFAFVFVYSSAYLMAGRLSEWNRTLSWLWFKDITAKKGKHLEGTQAKHLKQKTVRHPLKPNGKHLKE